MKKLLCLLLAASVMLLAGCSQAPVVSSSSEEKAVYENSAYSELTDDIDEYITGTKFSGSIMVTVNDEIAYSKAFGMADKSRGIKNSVDTVYQIGSVTKQMTGAAILRLESEGKLSLDDTLDKYFDGYDYLSGITVAQVCNMTAGFGNYLDTFLNTIKTGSGADVSVYTEDYIVKSILDEGTKFTPGTYSEYSNSGYYLLGRIIEQVSGETYREYLKKSFFDVYGMDNTGFIGDAADNNKGYTVKDFPVESPITYEIAYSAGGVISTTADIEKWLKNYSNDKFFNMVDSAGGSYGFGWNIEKNGVYTHGGTTPSYSSNVIKDKMNKINVIVLSNLSNANEEVTEPACRELWQMTENFLKK